MNNIIYFISGHRNITDDEFNDNYVKRFIEIESRWHEGDISEEFAPRYVVGDYCGVDIMSQNYLVDILKINPNRITVYHMFNKPRNINPKIHNVIGGFRTDEERDAEMTWNSTEDIAFVRDHLKLGGTGMNILRRRLLKRD